MIKDSGDRTEFETGAKRDMHAGKGRMDLLPWYGIMEVSKHCEEGALKYGEHNVDKGIPLHSLLDSASRHLAKYMVGMDDEDHLRAACWNLLWALNQRETHPELDDRFRVKKAGKARMGESPLEVQILQSHICRSDRTLDGRKRSVLYLSSLWRHKAVDSSCKSKCRRRAEKRR